MQDAITRCLGLVTQYNPLTVAPGALTRANDCVINRENVIEDRRGYATYMAIGSAGAQLTVYSGKVIAHNGSLLTIDSDGAGTPVNYAGSYNAPAGGFRMRAVESYSNLYLTTDQGIQVLIDTVGTAARKAGAPRSLDPSYALNAAGTGFLATSFQCAYRCVIQRVDANSNVLFGYPSTRLVVYNTAGTAKNVDLTLYLPAEVTVTDVIQFYRTAQISGTASDLSGDEEALVYQVNPTSTDITNGFVTFTDSVTDTLRGAALYTSPSQEGISQANDRPPLAKDIALYKSNYMIYANTSTKQRLFFTLVGTLSLTGNTLILGGVTYNFGASEITSGGGSPQVKVGATGVAAADIDSTARSLVRVINRYAPNTTIYAYYLSGPDDLPGQILIEERGIGASAYTIQSSNAAISTMTFPPAPVSPATSSKSTSSNSVQKNYLYYSKAGQPEAVPALNYIPVGASSKQILRIAPLRDSLVIIKEDGVFILRGETPSSFTISPLDLTVICKSMHSVTVLSNQVFMLSNQGIVSINDTGVQVISREIEPLIRPLITFANVGVYTAGAGYESERTYLLSTITSLTDTAPNQIFAYNIFTKTWVRWSFGFTAAVVESTADKLYFAKPSALTIHRERKDFLDTDYADPELPVTITGVTATTVSFTMGIGTPVVGGVIVQGVNALAITVLAVGQGSYTATIKDPVPGTVSAGPANYFPSVGMDIEWDTWTASQINSGMLKQVSQAVVMSDTIPGNNSASGLTVTFKTNFDEIAEGSAFLLPGGGWGAGAWGSFAWGGAGDSYGYRTWVPVNKQYCRTMNVGVLHTNSRERLVITGVALEFRVVSNRVGT